MKKDQNLLFYEKKDDTYVGKRNLVSYKVRKCTETPKITKKSK